MNLRLSLIAILAIGVTACASRSVKFDTSDVKVSREDASKECTDLGRVVGVTSSAKGTQEQALADLKQEAAAKGANYVVIKQYSSYGTEVTGIAYGCP